MRRPAGEQHASTIALDLRAAARQIRTAYDPDIGVERERHPTIGRALATAEPIAVTESWGRQHVPCCALDQRMAQIPGVPRFPSPIVFTNGVLRTAALHYLPVRADQAARDPRRKKTELTSGAHQRRRIRRIEDAPACAEYGDVQQEADLIAGHGVLQTTGLV